MKKTLIFAAALTCAAFTANAAVLVDNWGVNAFTTAFNQDFAATGNVATDNGGSAVLHIATKKGLYGDTDGLNAYFYSGGFGATNNLQFVVNDVLAGVSTITLELIGAGMPVSTAPLLNFNAANQGVAANSSSVIPGDEEVDSPMGPQKLTTYTYTWDVSSFGSADDFTIDFPLVLHNAIFEMNLSQTAVPEPSTYALIAGAFGLAAVVVARRRRA